MNETTMDFLNVAYVLWPATVVILYTVIIPVFVGIGWLICHWLDDGEESFKYPNIWEMNLYKGLLDWAGVKDIDALVAINILVGLHALAVSGVLYVAYKDFGLILPIWLLAMPLPLIAVRKLFRLGKMFNKHVADKSAHGK